VTELVEGESLRQYIQRRAPVAPEEAIDLVRKIADGLAYCHANGVIHRDLKPENILISKEGQPVIMDFGLALTKGSHRVTYSNLSATAGTPEYMAPEQVEGQRGDARTDIYASGVILYEMLSGQAPFTGDNNLAIMARHLEGVVPRLDHVQTGISIQLAAIVARCLQRNPDQRYASMNELLAALDHPEDADLTILEKAAPVAKLPGFWKSQVFRGIMAALLILVILVFFAYIAQTLRFH
jgi:serine/threonine-protein kinase